jgi:CBS-domain-containing membrane protein
VNSTVKDIMSTHVIAVRQSAGYKEMAAMLRNQRVSAFPVVDDDGRLIGIVTRSDVLSVYSRPDAEIQNEVTQVLIAGTFLSDPARFTVTVKDGIVTIEGTPETTQAGHDIIDAARHAEGVVAVRDRLTYPPDGTNATG